MSVLVLVLMIVIMVMGQEQIQDAAQKTGASDDRKQIGLNLFTTIHDGNFRRHSSMNVTIK